MPHKTFLAVIVYIYTGEIDMPISVDDALLLLAAANKYILPRLKTMCEMILVKELTVENVFSILLFLTNIYFNLIIIQLTWVSSYL